MGLLRLEHSRVAYLADFAAYGLACAAMFTAVAWGAPRGEGWTLAGLVLAGMAAWTFIEYLLHRFVLHGLKPFSTLHAEHHLRPNALICTPTLVSAGLILVLVYLPALAISADARLSGAATLGVVLGYLAYSIAHHATHHWRGGGTWLLRRKRWHALHHRAYRAPGLTPGHFGVTTLLWDRVFGSLTRPTEQARPA
jgi:cyclopropane-fatty-acyl-phospholipid synthase